MSRYRRVTAAIAAAEPQGVDGKGPQTVSPSQLAKHARRSDCWVAIHGKVYNVTGFLEDHPGGDDILLEYAGKDATNAFEDIGHTRSARERLSEYLVGTYTGAPQPPPVPPSGAGTGAGAGTAAVNEARNVGDISLDVDVQVGTVASPGAEAALDVRVVDDATMNAAVIAATKIASAKVVVSVTMQAKDDGDDFALGSVCGQLRTAHDEWVGKQPAHVTDMYSKKLEMAMERTAEGKSAVRFTAAFTKPVDSLGPLWPDNCASAHLKLAVEAPKPLSGMLDVHSISEVPAVHANLNATLPGGFVSRAVSMILRGPARDGPAVAGMLAMAQSGSLALKFAGMEKLTDTMMVDCGQVNKHHPASLAKDLSIYFADGAMRASGDVASQAVTKGIISSVKETFSELVSISVLIVEHNIIATLNCKGIDAPELLPDTF